MSCEVERTAWETAEANLAAKVTERDQANEALTAAQAAAEAAATTAADAYQKWLQCIL